MVYFLTVLNELVYCVTGDFQNGHARFSPSDEQEVPITMRSNADFTAVQQKLGAKKPFYKGISSVFK